MAHEAIDRKFLLFVVLALFLVLLLVGSPPRLTGKAVFSAIPIREPGDESALEVVSEPASNARNPQSLLDLIESALPLDEPQSLSRAQPSSVLVRPKRDSPSQVAGRARFKIDKKAVEDLEVKGSSDIIIELDDTALRSPEILEVIKGRKVLDHVKVRKVQEDIIAAVRQKDKEAGFESTIKVSKHFDRLPVLSLKIDAATLESLASVPGIKAIHADPVLSLSLSQSLPLVNAPQAWNMSVNGSTLSGAGQSICILDTGIDITHPSFAGRLLPGFNVLAQSSVVTDDNGHGTHVAGIAAAMAPGAMLIPIKVCAGDGSCKSSDVMAGIDFCLNASSSIASFTGSFGDLGHYDSVSCPSTIDQALFSAVNASILPVFASGNDGSSQGVAYPACSPYVIAVGASNKDGTIAPFSNRGSRLDILAPGSNVVSALPGGGFGSRSGTSAAVPFVAGAAALVKQYAVLTNQGASAVRVKNALIQGGRPGAGWPLLDALRSVEVYSNTTEGGIAAPSPGSPPEQTFQILVNPVVANVNITTITPNRSTSVACVWNYSDADADPENGTTWTWFINTTEAWRDPGLVAYFRFDQNTNDTMYLSNGSMINATNISGVIKTAYFFDGASAKIEVQNHSSLNFQNYTTLIAWVRSAGSSSSSNTGIMDKGGNPGTRGYNLLHGAFNSGSPHRIIFSIESTQIVSQTSINDSKWHHVVGSYNGTTSILYIDGVQENVSSGGGGGGTFNPGPSNLTIGIRSDLGSFSYFNGSLDEIKIFNRSLSSAEISYDYHMMFYGSTEKAPINGTPAPDIPVVAWHFDDNGSSNSSFDFFGDNIAVTSNATRTQAVFGTLGFSFNGTNAMLVANHTQSMNITGSNLTWMAWMSTSDAANVGYVVSKFAASRLSSYGILLNSSIVSCIVTNSTSNVTASARVTPDGTYHHIACIQNQTTLAISVNGSARNWTGSAGALNISAGGLYFGSLDGTSVFFNGSLDEVEFYSRAFTQDEINQTFRRSFPLFGLNHSAFGRNSSLTCQVEPIQMDGTAGTAVNSTSPTVMASNKVPVASRVNITPIYINTSISPAGVWNYSDENDFDPENGTTWTWFINNTEGWRDSRLLAYWSLDGNGVDRLGRFNGTINGTVTNVSGVVKGALNFTNDSFIAVSDSEAFRFDNFTLVVWVKFRDEDPDGSPFLSHDSGAGSVTKWIFMRTAGNAPASRQNRTGFHTRNSTEQVWVTGSPWNATLGRWYHIAMARSGSNFTFFRDGVEDGLDNTTFPIFDSNETPQIGRAEDIFDLNAFMDEVKIFNRTLTSAEVDWDYHMMFYGSTEKDLANGTPAPDIPVAAWHFDENTSATSNTFDYFGDISMIVNASPAQGVFGTQGFRFNGSLPTTGANTYLKGNHSQALNFSGNFTIILWLATGDSNNWGYVVSKLMYNESYPPSYGIWYNRSVISCMIGNATSNQSASIPIGTDNSFNHVACTYNSTELSVYLNGSKRNSSPFAGAINLTNESFFVGSLVERPLSSINATFNGTVDELELYNRPLSADEINQSYRRSFPLFGINRSAFGQNSSITFQIEPIQMDQTAGSAVNSTTIAPPNTQNPSASRVNITPFVLNKTISPAGVWNYSDPENDPENGSTYTWFINNSEAWRLDGLVSYWRFDGDANDTMGRNNGSLFNTSVEAGIIKSAMNFSFNVSNMTVGNDSSLNFVNFTSILFWIRTSGSPAQLNDTHVLNKGRNLGYWFYVGFPTGDDLQRMVFRLDNTRVSSQTRVDDSLWHHVAGTYDGTNMSIYVDGILENSTNKNGTFNPGSTATFLVGSDGLVASVPPTFSGAIDELKVFNRSLSADEVRYDYFLMGYGSTEKTPVLNTSAWNVPNMAWHFDDLNGSNTVFDFFGDNLGTISNATPVQGVFGTRGFSFNGTNAMIVSNFSQSMNFSENLTVLLWMSTNDSANVGYIVSKHHSGSLPSIGVRLNNSIVSCVISNDSSNHSASAKISTDGTFHHIGCRVSLVGGAAGTQTLELFVNGTRRNSTGILVSSFRPAVSANNLFFGSLEGTSVFFNGTLDEVEFYDRRLSDVEINTSARRPFPLFGMNSSRFGRNDSLTFQLEPIQTNGSAGTAVNSTQISTTTMEPPAVFPVNITPISINLSVSPAGVWNYTDPDNDPENGSTWTWFINNTEGWRDNNLVAYFRYDDGNINDTLGLAVGVGNVSQIPGIIKYASFFNGSNISGSGIVYANQSRFNMTPANQLSLTAWVNLNSPRGLNNTSVPIEDMTVVGKWNAGTDFDYAIRIIANRSSGIIYTCCRNGVTTNQVNGSITLLVGQWYHLGLTYNSSHVRVYTNGLLEATQAIDVPGVGGNDNRIQGTPALFMVGRAQRVAFPDFLNGTVDEVKVFNRTLSSVEIANEYQMMYYGSTEKEPQTGTPAPDVPVAAWHFDDNTGGTLAEDFFGDNNATLFNGSSFTSGVFGTNGLLVDGVNDYATAGGNSKLNLSNFTIIMWVLRTSNGSGPTPGLIAKGAVNARPYLMGMDNFTGGGASTVGAGVWFGNSEAIGGADQVCNATVLPLNIWTHIAYSYNGTSQRTYTNGSLINTCTPTSFVQASDTEPLVLGKISAGEPMFFNGTIDEVEMYSRALTMDEVNQSYRRSFPLFGLNQSVLGRNSTITFQLEPIQYNGTVGPAVNSTTLTTTAPPLGCGNISGDTNMVQDVRGNGTCFHIISAPTHLNCSGFTIRGNGSGILINATNLEGVTIRDCIFTNATFGVSLVNVSSVRVYNSSFGTLGLRLLQNQSTGHNFSIFNFNFNLTNLTLAYAINTTVENNSFQHLIALASGPATIVGESNRYVNNTISDGRTVLNDSAFRFERNIVRNHSTIDVQGSTELFFNNTFRNTTLNFTQGGFGRNSRVIENSFSFNGSETGQCLIFQSGRSSNQTIGNNTLLQCGISFLAGAGANSSVRDNTININISSTTRVAAIEVLNTTHLYINNATIFLNQTAYNITDGILVSASNNVTIANSTILHVEGLYAGVAVRINSSNNSIIEQSGFNAFNGTIEFSGAQEIDNRITLNQFADRNPDRTPCLLLGRASTDIINRTEVRGNVFNCTSSMIVADGSTSQVADLNISDNRFLNGTVMVGVGSPVHMVLFSNNSLVQQRLGRSALEIINTTWAMVVNNTFGNATGDLSVYVDAENVSVLNNVFANSSFGINASGGTGLFISNATFSLVRNSMIIMSAFNATVNNTRTLNFTRIGAEMVGYINFTAGVNFTLNVSLISFINVSNNSAYVNSSRQPGLNASAIVRLFNISNLIPKVKLREADNQTEQDCPRTRCVNLSFDSTSLEFVFNVTQFTGYGAGPEAAPRVINGSPNNSIFLRFTGINISMNVTDEGTIDIVLANVSSPNGTMYNLTFLRNSATSDIFNATFNDTSQPGMYTVRFIANDTMGYVNNTETINFSIQGLASKFNALSISCSQTAALNDQVVCSVSARSPENGTALPGILIYYNVTNSTSVLIARGNATDIGAGNYRINFSSPNQGGYVVSINQDGTTFGASTATMVRQGFGVPKILATGTLFFPETRIVVDAIYLSTDGIPLSSAGCNLSLVSQNLSTILQNQTMQELDFGGISHYMYNATNITNISLNWTEGIFFGHVRCDRSGPTGGIAFGRVGFEVRRFNTSSSSGSSDLTDTLNSLNDTRVLLKNIIDRSAEFSREEVFLVTDAFNSMSDVSSQVMAGTLSPQEAQEKISIINQTVAQKLGERYHKVASSALSRSPDDPLIDIHSVNHPLTAAKSKSWGMSGWLFAGIVVVALVCLILPLFPKKKRRFPTKVYY